MSVFVMLHDRDPDGTISCTHRFNRDDVAPGTVFTHEGKTYAHMQTVELGRDRVSMMYVEAITEAAPPSGQE